MRTTFKEFVEAKDNKEKKGDHHLRLTLSVGGEPVATDRGKTNEKKGKHRLELAWDAEGEVTTIRK